MAMVGTSQHGNSRLSIVSCMGVEIGVRQWQHTENMGFSSSCSIRVLKLEHFAAEPLGSQTCLNQTALRTIISMSVQLQYILTRRLLVESACIYMYIYIYMYVDCDTGPVCIS